MAHSFGAHPRVKMFCTTPVSLWFLMFNALSQGPPAPTRSLPSDSAIRAILQERVASNRNAAIVVGLLDEQGRRIVAQGKARDRGAVPLDGKTVFEIGSVTKVFTAALLADMTARGEVRFDDPVAKYLPPGVTVPTRGGQQITLLHLAVQNSGLPRLPANLTPTDPENPYADYTVQQLYQFLSSYALPRGIGERYEYSNLGVGLLGHALARRAGKTYEDLLRERILEPLGMRDTRIQLSPELQARLAAGHTATGQPASNWDLPTLAGAGALRSTANDMLTFLAANLDTSSAELPSALRATQAARAPTDIPDVEIGLGWHLLRKFGRTIVWHNGGTGGYHAFVGFDSQRRAGLVVLTNSASSIDDIALHLLDERLPLAHPSALIAHVEVAVDSAVLERYVGAYELAPNFVLTVTRQGKALFAQATGQPNFPVYAESDTSFFYKVVDAQLTFARDTAGKVTGVVLHQAGRQIPGRKTR